MKRTKKILSTLVIFLLPFLLGNTIGECGFFKAIFLITLPPPIDLVSYNDMETYHSGGYILAADNGKIYYTNSSSFPPESIYVVPGYPDLLDIEDPFYGSGFNIIVGDTGTIVRSTEENPQWILIPSPVTYKLNKIVVEPINPITLTDYFFIVGDNGTILKSTDLGLTWSIIPFPYSDNLKDIKATYEGEDLKVSGDNYALYRSTNGGVTWFPIGPSIDKPSGPHFSYNKIFFYNDTLGFVGGPNGLVLKTTDGGWNWSILVASGIEQINDLYFISPDTGAAVGINGQVRFTTDGGNNWFEETAVTDFLAGRDVRRILALSRNHGFVVGDGDLLTFAAKDSTYLDSTFVTSVEDDISFITDFILYQNYPNPFNPTTNIKFQIAEFGSVTLAVFDMLGRKVATLVNEEKSAGVYDVEFSAEGLTSGIYFYQLKSRNFVETKKLVLLK
ncbi:MAG TPA: YCF48-related protein [Ignavibacteriaceae bacterium]|nr:YCF48-related protein [Ignavibacteriaceae bacterium]